MVNKHFFWNSLFLNCYYYFEREHKILGTGSLFSQGCCLFQYKVAQTLGFCWCYKRQGCYEQGQWVLLGPGKAALLFPIVGNVAQLYRNYDKPYG